MSLLDRMRANLCGFVGCDDERMRDTALCPKHLLELNRNQLDRLDDHTFVSRRRLPPADMTGKIRSAAA